MPSPILHHFDRNKLASVAEVRRNHIIIKSLQPCGGSPRPLDYARSDGRCGIDFLKSARPQPCSTKHRMYQGQPKRRRKSHRLLRVCFVVILFLFVGFFALLRMTNITRCLRFFYRGLRTSHEHGVCPTPK